MMKCANGLEELTSEADAWTWCPLTTQYSSSTMPFSRCLNILLSPITLSEVPSIPCYLIFFLKSVRLDNVSDEAGSVSDEEENDNGKKKKREIRLLTWNNASWFMRYIHILTQVNRLHVQGGGWSIHI